MTKFSKRLLPHFGRRDLCPAQVGEPVTRTFGCHPISGARRTMRKMRIDYSRSEGRRTVTLGEHRVDLESHMSRTPAPAAIAAASVALLALATLSGCVQSTTTAGPTATPGTTVVASPAPTATATPTPTPTPTPTATTAGPPALPANALLAISATVTASNGASAKLYQVVYAPITADASDTALLDKQCNFSGTPKWETQYPANPVYVTSTMTATLTPGSPAFSTKDPINFDLGWGDSAYSGNFSGFEAACAAGYINVPGTVHGVMVVPSSNPAHGTYGWATKHSRYGFFGGGNDPGPDSSGSAVVAQCVVQVSAAASAASAKIAAWATQPYTKSNACDFEIN
jgi:hypothetical protein